MLAEARRPVLVLGTDVWADGAEDAALRLVEAVGVPAVTNGMGRGVLPGGHPLLVARARAAALGLPTSCSWSGRLSTSGSASAPSAARTPPRRPGWCTSPTPPARWPGTPLAASASGDLTLVLEGVLEALRAQLRARTGARGVTGCSDVAAAGERDDALLSSEADPIHPARVYGELNRRLADDAVVIGDGGDFVSFAGKYVEPSTPGVWLDPGPYGCLGTGLG